jgi:hypothetical protein
MWCDVFVLDLDVHDDREEPFLLKLIVVLLGKKLPACYGTRILNLIISIYSSPPNLQIFEDSFSTMVTYTSYFW